MKHLSYFPLSHLAFAFIFVLSMIGAQSPPNSYDPITDTYIIGKFVVKSYGTPSKYLSTESFLAGPPGKSQNVRNYSYEVFSQKYAHLYEDPRVLEIRLSVSWQDSFRNNDGVVRYDPPLDWQNGGFQFYVNEPIIYSPDPDTTPPQTVQYWRGAYEDLKVTRIIPFDPPSGRANEFPSNLPDYKNYEAEKVNGVIASQKSWQIYDEDFVAPNGSTYNTLVQNEFQYYGNVDGQKFAYRKEQTYSSRSFEHGTPVTNIPPNELLGKTARISYADGRVDTFWYEYGSWDSSSKVFTPGVGTAYRETVIHGTKDFPMGMENQTTRSVLIRDNTAYLVREETQLYTGSGYQLLSRTDYANNPEGNPLTITKDGRVIQTNTYTDGQKMSETDETGIITEYTYDDLGNIETSTKRGVAAGSGYQAQPDIVTTYTYDATGRQTGQVVTAGSLTQTTSSTYDKAGRLETETMNGLTTSHSYWSGGLFHQITQPNGATQVTETFLDGKTKSITGTGVIPQYYSYAIDSSASQLGFQSTTVRTGSENDLQYEITTQDLLGRTTLVQRPGFNNTTWLQQSYYNDLGQLVKVTQTGSADQLTTYNAVGEVLRSGLDIDGDGALTSASTDRFSEITTDYSFENSTWYRISTSKQYLKDGQSTASTTIQKEALSGTPQTILYDALGNMTKTTTTIDRDAKTVTQTTDTPDSTIDAVAVTVNGLLVSQSSNTNSAASLFYYDSLGRQTETIQQDGVMTSQTYNANGQIETQKDAANNVTTIQYYAQTELGAGQPKLVTQPDNTTISYQYDFLGNKTRESGSATYPVDYEYNAKGQKTKMFTYRSLGAVGNKSQGDSTVWSYDPVTGLLLSKTDATNKSTQYTYHPSGQLKTRLWARGITTNYDYNTAGELTSVDYSDTTPDVTMNYDRSGQPTTITDGSGTRTFSSTINAFPTGFTYTAGALNTLSVGYTYDGIGRMDSMTAGGRTTNYGYRGEGRLGTVTHQGSTATYGYKPNSDLIQTTTYSSGAGTRLTTTRNYDSSDRLGSVVNAPGSGSSISRSYSYNSRNQRTQSTLANGDYWKYDYNSKGEVTSGIKKNSTNANLLGHEYAYTFDEIGNRLTTTTNSKLSSYTPNALNQYDSRTIPPFTEILGSANTVSTVTVNNQATQRQADLFFVQLPADNSVAPVYSNNSIVGVRNNADASGNDALQNSSVKKIVPKTPEAFTYDFDGNVLSDGRFNYTWDGENRLIKIESLSSAPAADKKQINFIYDAQSRRVSKKSYTWSGTAWVLADSRRFLYDQFNLLAEINDTGTVLNSYAWGTDLSGSLYGAGGVGGLLLTANLSTVESLAYDANGNILAYVSNTGAVTSQFEYGPFGELIRSSGTPPCNFGFSTKYRDGETGLNYYGYRYYNANLGRWINRDPAEEFGGLNLNGFIGNNGINRWDFLGLLSLSYTPPPDGSVTPFELGFEWLTGLGPRTRYFKDGDLFAEMMRSHEHIQNKIKEITKTISGKCGEDIKYKGPYTLSGQTANYNLGGVQGVGKYLADYASLLTFGGLGNLAVTFTGSYKAEFKVEDIDCCKKTANLKISLYNKSHAASALRPPVLGYTALWQQYVAPLINDLFKSGALSPTEQNVKLNEKLNLD